jgi:hypothetical protein
VTHDPRFFPANRPAAPRRRIHLYGLHQSSQLAFRTWIEGAAPWLWNSVIKVLLDQPVFAVLGVVGILLMILFRPRKPLIGYSRD